MKKKMMIMIKIPIMSLAVWLLFLISALSLPLSHALQDNSDKLPSPAGAKFHESSLEEEETLVGFDAIGLRKMGNGRKRVAVKRMRKEITTNDEREDQEDHQESSRIISGLKKKSSLQTSQVKDQESTIDANRSRNSQHLKEKLTDSKLRDEETQRLLKAAKEIANLMHKDYKDWAHRKPPINNQEPLH